MRRNYGRPISPAPEHYMDYALRMRAGMAGVDSRYLFRLVEAGERWRRFEVRLSRWSLFYRIEWERDGNQNLSVRAEYELVDPDGEVYAKRDA